MRAEPSLAGPRAGDYSLAHVLRGGCRQRRGADPLERPNLHALHHVRELGVLDHEEVADPPAFVAQEVVHRVGETPPRAAQAKVQGETVHHGKVRDGADVNLLLPVVRAALPALAARAVRLLLTDGLRPRPEHLLRGSVLDHLPHVLAHELVVVEGFVVVVVQTLHHVLLLVVLVGGNVAEVVLRVADQPASAYASTALLPAPLPREAGYGKGAQLLVGFRV